MPKIRATLFFSQKGYGWTETGWFDGASTDLNTYFGKIDALAQKRIKLCGNNTFLPYLRWSQEGVFRDVALWAYPGSGLQGGTGKDSDAPTTALLLNLRNSTATRRKNVYLRGVWDEGVIAGGVYSPTPAYVALMNDYIAQLVADGWGWLGVNTTTLQNISGVTQQPSGLVQLTFAGNLFPGPFPAQFTVNISGVQGAAQVNGVQRVIASSATICETKNRISIFPWTAGGRGRLNTQDLITIAGGTVRRVVERKAGRPSYLSRGRRRAQVAS